MDPSKIESALLDLAQIQVNFEDSEMYLIQQVNECFTGRNHKQNLYPFIETQLDSLK